MAKLRDLVQFRGERLFNGAVSIDWFGSDEEKTEQACKAFVFHGPEYHGVKQSDVGAEHGHQLKDTATFTRSIVRRCAGIEEQPFTLAIAGYGTGKSHLALTIGQMLAAPDGQLAQEILGSLRTADADCAKEIDTCLKEMGKPCLVIALNGMSNFDLAAEVTSRAIERLQHHQVSTKVLDDLRPRFAQAARMLKMCDRSIVGELPQSCGKGTLDEVIDALGQQDEHVYSEVHRFFANLGIPIVALGGESVKDVIEAAAREYVGGNRPFAHLLILFDEFGRYTEFATVRHQIAGSGVLQQLFEGIQASKGAASFVGFIQYDLNSYAHRVAPELRNDILRVITRYQSSDKAYLSVNLETLIASLIEKRRPKQLGEWFDSKTALQDSAAQMRKLVDWFPQMQNHIVWTDPVRFHQVVRKGCWPLSPAATWFLYHLAAAGCHLQGRSAIALLGDFFRHWNEAELIVDTSPWSAAPVDLWSGDLEHEFLASEEGGTQGMVTHSYCSVVARHEIPLGPEGVRILRAVVLASKLGLSSHDKDSALAGIALLAGRDEVETRRLVGELQQDFNVLEWDAGFRQFDILGDAASKVQFLAHIRGLVAGTYDGTAPEWRFDPMLSNSDMLSTHLKLARDSWMPGAGLDQARGTIIYCYVGPSKDPEEVTVTAAKALRNMCREIGVVGLPIIVLFITDEDNQIGNVLAELAVITESLSAEEESRFRSLVPAHKEKLLLSLTNCIEDRIKQQVMVAGRRERPEGKRLTHIATRVFDSIYSSPLPFPFDGFATIRGNAAETCWAFTRELVSGTLDHDSYSAKPPKEKNRADAVLNRSWRVISKSGSINRLPGEPAARAITIEWDKMLQGKVTERLTVSRALQLAMRPPHGANIASAGLLLGVFLSTRRENVAVVRGGEQIDLSHWLQSNIWRGKYLDLDKLETDEIVAIGEACSEWETLLGDWEQAESYIDRIEFGKRATELRKRVAVPPALRYRVDHLQEQAVAAIVECKRVDDEEDRCLKKIQKGCHFHDVGTLSWGAVELLKIRKIMELEPGRWQANQICSNDHVLAEAKSAITRDFPRWVSNQAPNNARPDTVGEFKNVMRHVCGNFEKLGFTDLARELDERVMSVIRNVENATEAKQLVMDVSRFIDRNSDAFGLLRLRRLRDLKTQADTYSTKLVGMARRVDTSEVTEARAALMKFREQLVTAEKQATTGARLLMKMRIKTEQDLESTWRKLEEIERIFEGCDRDLEDFAVMRDTLQAMREAARQLDEDNMSWEEFERKADMTGKRLAEDFAEKESPWDIAELFDQLVQARRAALEERSIKWIDDIEQNWARSEAAPVDELNRLYSRLVNPPAWLSPKTDKQLRVYRDEVEKKLRQLEVEWLVERFQQLPDAEKKDFLSRIGTQPSPGKRKAKAIR
ncbi:MAG: hypothetical protein NTY46_14695 [Candidatus Sumerlaeota bacterium]|nr:hypothetical protein [Candidatus Sumerlaeota bacterium]